MPTDEANRKLRRHRKSRYGCGNCKFRKIKCDENKPTCEKCKIYGTYCNYDSKYSELQPLSCKTSSLQAPQKAPAPEAQLVLGVLNNRPNIRPKGTATMNDSQYLYNMRDLEQVVKFHTRTICTLPTRQNIEAHREIYAKLTYSHPFLLHVVIALTMLHDQHLNLTEDPKLAAAVAFHWSRGAALMNAKLYSNLNSSDRDALWCCAGLLGALSFASSRAKIPEESWPLIKSSNSDLNWLKMSEGKKAIWEITNPQRPDSMFHSTMPDFLAYGSVTAASISELQKLPPELIQLCGLDCATIDDDQNPYLPSASFLAGIMDMHPDPQSVGKLLCFFGGMHPRLKRLLEEKDPCALLLLALWYAKMNQCTQCWIWKRTLLEYQAILRYLRLYYSYDDRIIKVVRAWESDLLEIGHSETEKIIS